MEKTLVFHSDGGARGNPGPGACAFVVEQNGKVIAKGSKKLGEVTNNLAEYSGVILALEWLTKNITLSPRGLPITFYMDSELVVRQLMGKYKVKDVKLKKMYEEINKVRAELPVTINFESVSREKNKLADFLVNKELDSGSP